MRERRYSASGRLTRVEERAGEVPKITGLAAVYYDGSPGTEFGLYEDAEVRVVERILPGSFDVAASGDDVRALFNHDPNQLLGRTSAGTLRLELRADGLGYSIDPPDTPVGRTVLEAIRRGDLTGSSFAFDVVAQRWEESQAEDGRALLIREIREVALYDVGPVTFPAYGATSAGMRSEAAEVSQVVRQVLEDRKARAGAVSRAIAAARARAVSLDD